MNTTGPKISSSAGSRSPVSRTTTARFSNAAASRPTARNSAAPNSTSCARWRTRWAAISLALLAAGCAIVKPSGDIKQLTVTFFGVELAQNQTTQLYELRAGLSRTQVTVVPTDKERAGTNAGSAASCPDFESHTKATGHSAIFGDTSIDTGIAVKGGAR